MVATTMEFPFSTTVHPAGTEKLVPLFVVTTRGADAFPDAANEGVDTWQHSIKVAAMESAGAFGIEASAGKVSDATIVVKRLGTGQSVIRNFYGIFIPPRGFSTPFLCADS